MIGLAENIGGSAAPKARASGTAPGQRLHGSFHDPGFSFEWHDFKCQRELDWSKSFPPESVTICLNLDGHGRLFFARRGFEYEPLSAGFFSQERLPLRAIRPAAQRHQFVSVHFSHAYLKGQLAGWESHLHPLVCAVLKGTGERTGVAPAIRLSCRHEQLAFSLRQPPLQGAAQRLWFQSKALELMAEFFMAAPPGEHYCSRLKCLARERVQRVVAILQQELASPPSLEEISRKVGCSQFYLSRTFSAEMRKTIPQYLRQLRMERAAELLKTGRLNVTEAALEVGYSSLSHFSEAFHQTFGCCPGLFPLASAPRRTTGSDARTILQ